MILVFFVISHHTFHVHAKQTSIHLYAQRVSLKITKALYKNEESKLFSRSAAGRKHKGESKSEISIEKKELMKSMLNERLGHELSNDSVLEFAKRTKNFNAFLRSAIHNIKNGLKKDQVCNFIIIEIIFQNMALYFVYFFVL